MRAYSMDLRKRVLTMSDAGRSTREVERIFAVTESWVRRLKKRRREDGRISPRLAGGRRHGHFDAERLQRLEQWLRRHPDATLEWLLGRVEREMGLRCSVMAVCRAVKKLGWSFKKKRFALRSEIVRTWRGAGSTSQSRVVSLTSSGSFFSMNPAPRPT